MNDEQIIQIARIKLPLVVELFNRANLEAQKANPDLDALQDIINGDDMDMYYDIYELLSARSTTKRILAKAAKAPKAREEGKDEPRDR